MADFHRLRHPPGAEVIAQAGPDIVVTHSCGAHWDGDLNRYGCGANIAVCAASGNTTVIETRMEALDRATVGRQDLRDAATASGIDEMRLRIPSDVLKIS